MGFKFLPKNKIARLPKSSGVYAFKKGWKFLYIGKAKNIRERVKNHSELLGLAAKVAYIETDSEIEALLLEAKLIKKYQPKYNVVWRDDKNYFYICITKQDFPRLFITHQACPEPAAKLGPFVDGKALKKTLRILRKVFPYYTQKKHPEGLCPWCHLGLCPGPNPNRKEYKKSIKNLISVLEGKRKVVLKNLKKEMKKASDSQDFEKAAKIRDQITALEKVLKHDNGRFKRIEAYDISNIQGKEATGSMVVFQNGKPAKSQYRRFKIKMAKKPNDVAMLKEVLRRRFKHQEWPCPDLILIDGGKAQLNAATSITKIPAMALAKKENKLYIEGRKRPVLLKSLPREISNLILQLRDEAHRFARKYHHKLREKSLLN